MRHDRRAALHAHTSAPLCLPFKQPPPSFPQSGDARQVTLVQTGLTVTLTQPWSAAEGKWQPQLEVKVTLTQAPAAGVKLGGALGATLPTGVAAQSLKARIASIAASAAPK